MSFISLLKEINGRETDIVLSKFRDNVFILVTQNKKPGPFFIVKKGIHMDTLSEPNELFFIRNLFGLDSEGDGLSAASFIAKELRVPNNSILSLDLSSDPRSLKDICNIILPYMTW